MRPHGVWPWMVAATILVMVVPPAVVWALSALGVITTLWAGVAIAALLALAASSAGSAFWRRRATGDVLFSDLLLWGWLRRRRMEGRLGRADELLEQAGGAETEDKAVLLHELGAALDSQDPYLDGHSRRVARYVTMIADRMDLPGEDVERVRAAAAVHDVGKLHIPREIVYKPGRLTDEEFEQMKQHAGEGGEMVECLDDPALAAAIRSHHERWDGSGYPDGLAGEQIPIEARIISVADTFDAITSARAYRPATPHARALEVIADEAGEQLDPRAARAFISCYSDRRGAALWASLLSIPRQLASRLSMTPAELTGAATAALTAPMIVVAGAAASAALPTPTTDIPAATSQPVALSQPASTPGASPTPTRSPTAAVVPPAPTNAGAAPPAATTPPPSPTPAATETPTPVPTLMPLPMPAFATPTPTPTPVPAPSPTPTPTSAPTPTATPTPPPPHSAEDCTNGGWIDLGYPNQGQCIAEAGTP